VELYFHAFLTSALDGGKLSASSFGRFTPGERAAGSRWVGSWVGPRTALDAMVWKGIMTVYYCQW